MSGIARLSGRVPPDAALTNAAHRALLGAWAIRLRRADDGPAGAIARALATTALGRFTAGEREWIERIEARRERLGAEGGEFGGPDRWAPAHAWSMPRVWGRFLLRLVGELGPRSPIELGTGFGISGSYQAAGLEGAGAAGPLTTLDREQSLIPLARAGFTELGLADRVRMIEGPIGETLEPTARGLAPIDYALIDAEHTEPATVYNFDTLAPHLAGGAVVVVDDILSSPDMRRAWETIRRRPAVRSQINLRRLGLVVAGDG